MIYLWEDLLMRYLDWLRHSNTLMSSVKYAQHHGNQARKRFMRIQNLRRLKIIGRASMIRSDELSGDLRFVIKFQYTAISVRQLQPRLVARTHARTGESTVDEDSHAKR